MLSHLPPEVLALIAALLPHPWLCRVDRATHAALCTAAEVTVRQELAGACRRHLLRQLARDLTRLHLQEGDVHESVLCILSAHVSTTVVVRRPRVAHAVAALAAAAPKCVIEVRDCGDPPGPWLRAVHVVGNGAFARERVAPDLSAHIRLRRIGTSAFARAEGALALNGCETLEEMDDSAFGAASLLPSLRGCVQLWRIGKHAFATLHTPPDLTDCGSLEQIDVLCPLRSHPTCRAARGCGASAEVRSARC